MKNKKLLIISGGIVLLFSLFLGCGGHAGEKEYNKALSSWKSGDLVRAQGQMEKAIRKLSDKKKKATANNQLGIILWNLDKQEQATKQFAESCRLTEDLTGANLNLAITLYHSGQMEQSEFEFTKILSEQPNNSTVLTFMGLIHMHKKDWKNASKEISSSLRIQPNNPAGQNTLALAELHLNRTSDSAVKRLKQIISAYPDYAPAAYNLAVIYDQWLNNNLAAKRWYKQYLTKATPGSLQISSAEQAMKRLAQKTGPSRSSQMAGTPTERASLFIAEGSKLHGRKEYSHAVKQYQKAIQADPSQKTAFYNMGLSYYELKNYPEAVNACKKALKLDPSFANSRYMLALSYAQQSKWNEAEREAKALKKVDTERGKAILKYISDTRKK